MRRFLLLICLPSVLLAGCVKEDLGGTDTGTDAQAGEITFNICFAPQTKVSTAVDFNSSWEHGDVIGIFAVENGFPLNKNATANYIHNMMLTYIENNPGNPATGTWIPQGDVFYWPNNGNKLDFYAYYPYNDNNNNPSGLDPTEIAFNVLADQSGTTQVWGTSRSNYNFSDLLTAKSTNENNGWGKGETVTLAFSHAMAMVQVSIPSEGKGFGPGKGLKVTLRGMKSKAVLNLSNVDADEPGKEIKLAATDNNTASIVMHRVEQPGDANFETNFTYRALVPAQEVAQGNRLFRFEHEKRQLLEDKPLDAKLQMKTGIADKFERTLPSTLIHTVPVNAGTFNMGSPEAELGRQSDETQHQVTLTQDFYIGKYPITFTQFAAFLNAKGIGNDCIGTVDGYGQKLLLNISLECEYDNGTWKIKAGMENHPATYVSWFGAKAYADWVGGALPTEAQWEYACRAGSTEAFGMGINGEQITSANLGDYGWYDESGVIPKEIGQKKPNDWGLYDMHGNVGEWCYDWYGDYGGDAVTDPTGPSSGNNRVYRGGTFNLSSQYCRSASRFFNVPSLGPMYVGFRVVFY